MSKQKSALGWRSVASRLFRKCKKGWRNQFITPVKQSSQLRYFWMIGLAGGVLMVLLTPPLMGFDETSHFRAVTFYAEGGQRDVTTPPEAVKTVEINANTAQVIDIAGGIQRKQVIQFSMYDFFLPRENAPQGYAPADLGGAAVYSPVAYAPPIIGTAAAKTAHLPVLFQIWAGRLACLITYLVLVYFALRCLPFGKWALFVIALLPMSLFQAATITTDGFLNGLVFLFVAAILRLMVGELSTAHTKQLLAAVAVCAGLIALSKPTYAALAVLPFAIPAARFTRKKGKWIFATAVLGLSSLLAAAWNFAVKDLAVKIGEVYRAGFNVNYDEQLASVLHHPLHFLAVMLRTIVQNGQDYLSQMIGVFDPWFHLLPFFIVLPLLIVLILGILVDADKIQERLRAWVRVLFFLVLCGLASLILLTLYLTYTPFAFRVVDGVQGRYFLPLLILLIPVLGFKKLRVNIKRPERLFVPVVALAILFSCVYILRVNYWL